MSTRTDWGIFDKDGKPLAVGDEHHGYKCPNQKWDYTSGFEHPITGEFILYEPSLIPCPWKSEAVKLDRCKKCGNEFRYP